MSLKPLIEAAQKVAIPDRELAIELLNELSEISELPYAEKLTALEGFLTSKRLLIMKNIEV